MRGAVAAGHPLTVEAGSALLAAGGNAVDAAVGAVLASFVAEGPLTGATGGGFALVHPRGGPVRVLDCFFATPHEPLAPTMDEVVIDFEDAGTQVFHVGEGSVAVPGLLAGLEEVHRSLGSLPWPALVEPALDLARTGFAPSDEQGFVYRILGPILLRSEEGSGIYGDPGWVDTTALASTLELVRDEAARATRELLPELEKDLDAYAVAWREPRRLRYRGYDLATTPAPSRGGEIVASALEMLDSVEGVGTTHELVRILSIAYGQLADVTRPTGTTHVSVVDRDGNAIAISSTLGSGSGVFRQGSELNNMLGELDVIGLEPRPPGARLPSMMAPTIALEGDSPRLVLGSAGSVRLAAAIVQVVRAALGGADVRTAIDAPRLFVDGDVVHLEGGWPSADIDLLQREGRDVIAWTARNLFFGGVAAVEATRDGGLAAAGDPRRGGHGAVTA